MRRALAFVLGTALIATAGAAAPSQAPEPQARRALKAEQAITQWKAIPQEVAREMIAKYGEPQEVTANRLIWHDNGPWKYSELVNEEIPHDFPMPHKDMLYQAIDYEIDPDKADELLQYDGSIILERTKGEIAARCDKEAANFLAINLAHDIASGRRSVEEARRFYGESVMTMKKENRKNEYLQGFRFQVPQSDQGDPDAPVGPVGTSGRDRK